MRKNTKNNEYSWYLAEIRTAFVLNTSLERIATATHSVVYLSDTRGSSVSIVTRLRVGRPGFDSWQGKGFFSLCHCVQTDFAAHVAFYTVRTGDSFPGDRPGREANHSPSSSAEIKNAWSYTSTPKYVFMAWCSFKYRDNFISSFDTNKHLRTTGSVIT
jgi:hypothetical protein